MRPIKSLFGSGKGKDCVLVGRGISAHTVSWPIMADVFVVNSWPGQAPPLVDYYIFSDLVLYQMQIDKGNVFPEGAQVIGPTPVIEWANTKRMSPAQDIDYFYDPHLYPLEIDKKKVAIRSGMRALKLAVDMGYDYIYLVGFDYKPMENYDSPDMVKRLDTQLKEYKLLDWPANRIIQTNPESRLKFKEKK